MSIFPSSSAIQPAVDETVGGSLRFNDDDSAYLSWTPSSIGNRKTWTWSGWVKRGNLGIAIEPFSSTGGSTIANITFTTADTIDIIDYTSSYQYRLTTTQVFRDPSAWYHIVFALDTTQATSSNRAKLYVNGEQVTAFSTSTYPSQNYDGLINTATQHSIGRDDRGFSYFDGYLAEVNFIDGGALDADDFGETDANGQWIPKEYTGSYGTNGFYLPFTHDYSVEGFSATTYRGNGGTQYIGGVGFEPDLVWIKRRSGVAWHQLMDSVRGVNKQLYSNETNAEDTRSGIVSSFDSDGFTLGTSDGDVNGSGATYVAWCWDAGTGSAVSNTDGSITSTVKASTDYGFSIVSWTASGTPSDTIGHGLSSAPEMIIVKDRDATSDWCVYSQTTGAGAFVKLNDTAASTANTTMWNNTSPTSSVFNWGYSGGNDIIAYCFHSVSGYSKFGSYTGTGASGNTVTFGFRPSMVLVKCTSDVDNWFILDTQRKSFDSLLLPNSSSQELDYDLFDVTDTGIVSKGSDGNISGRTYIYMAFADKREAAFWLDQSGNNNDWENNNLTESDISLDSPTNNFATLNPLQKSAYKPTLSEGNMKGTGSATQWCGVYGTMSASTGKWYFESLISGQYTFVGIQLLGNVDWDNTNPHDFTGAIAYYSSNGYKYVDGTSSAFGSTSTSGDILGVAVDMDAGSMTIYKNGSSLGSISFTGSSYYGEGFIPFFDIYSTANQVANFGQDSSFAGNKTAQGNTDDNGYGDFYYAPPSGYLALCTANLPDPTVVPDEHFNTVLYTGNGSTNAITGVGFQPDWVWLKSRSTAQNNYSIDAVRGVNNILVQNNTNAESYYDATWRGLYGNLTSLDADGFTVVDGTDVTYDSFNGSGDTYVAWNWKAGGSGVSNTDGSITSTVSANTDAGFSIVSYAGTASQSTVGHGLSQAPQFIVTKNRDYNGDSWITGSDFYTSWQYYGALNSNNTQWNGNAGIYATAPTSSVFTVGTDRAVNSSGYDYISYCFHSIDGFSKFGKYTGNGSTDGTFCYTGFRPAFVMIKNISTSGTDWIIVDVKRDTYNVMDSYLRPNTSDAESTYTLLDATSNGFKMRNTGNNQSGDTMIYLAFAETPFKYANAR